MMVKTHKEIKGNKYDEPVPYSPGSGNYDRGSYKVRGPDMHNRTPAYNMSSHEKSGMTTKAASRTVKKDEDRLKPGVDVGPKKSKQKDNF